VYAVLVLIVQRSCNTEDALHDERVGEVY